MAILASLAFPVDQGSQVLTLALVESLEQAARVARQVDRERRVRALREQAAHQDAQGILESQERAAGAERAVFQEHRESVDQAEHREYRVLLANLE